MIANETQINALYGRPNPIEASKEFKLKDDFRDRSLDESALRQKYNMNNSVNLTKRL